MQVAPVLGETGLAVGSIEVPLQDFVHFVTLLIVIVSV